MAEQKAAAPVAVDIKKPAVAAAPAAAAAPKEVKGVAQDIVQVEYKGKNVHVFHGVWSIAPGISHLPKEVWEAAKSYPANAKLIASELLSLVDGSAKKAKPEAKSEKAAG